MEEVEIIKEYKFDAAHFLPRAPDGHKCRRMHGHTFRFKIHVKGPVQKEGWVMDFGDISRVVKPIIEESLDHYTLNDIPGLENPTSEMLAIWLWEKIRTDLPLLNKITVYETCTSYCEYHGPGKE